MSNRLAKVDLDTKISLLECYLIGTTFGVPWVDHSVYFHVVNDPGKVYTEETKSTRWYKLNIKGLWMARVISQDEGILDEETLDKYINHVL